MRQKLVLLKKALKVKPTPELISFFHKRELLKFNLNANRKALENMLNFSMGYKRPKPSKYGTYVRTTEDEFRMIKTIKHLHDQNRLIKKQLIEELKNVDSK